MSLARTLRINRIFLYINVGVLASIIALAVWAWDQGYLGGDVIEAKQIILRGDNGMPSMILQGDGENTLMTLNDQEGNVRLQLQGGAFPAVIMKNEAQEIVGTFFPLRDGGSGIGLGDANGNMATFIRGGSSPTMSFYQKSHEPNIALGISDQLPHFVMFPVSGKEGMVIHGNSPTSILFIDENGEVPISLSRHGLHSAEAQKETETQQSNDDEKIFSSYDELQKNETN